MSEHWIFEANTIINITLESDSDSGTFYIWKTCQQCLLDKLCNSNTISKLPEIYL